MDTQGQIGVFLLYVGLGFACGILYEVFALLRLLCGCRQEKHGVLGGIFDVAFWVCACVFVGACAFFLHIPALRAYMWLGLLLGGIIYLKTLRRIVAFLENLCYNKCKSLWKKAKTKRKNLKKRVKEKV